MSSDGCTFQIHLTFSNKADMRYNWFHPTVVCVSIYIYIYIYIEYFCVN